MFGRFRGRGRGRGAGWDAGWFPRCGLGLGLGYRWNNSGSWGPPPWSQANQFSGVSPTHPDYKSSLESAKSALEQRLAEINAELERQP